MSSLGIRASRTAERRQRRRRLLKWAFALGAIATLGVASYRIGAALAEREVARLRADVDRLSAEVGQLQERNTRALASAEAARMREADWRRRFQAEVPTGNSRALMSLLQAALAKGMDLDRIRFVFDAASRPRSCDGEPVTKRFLVRTPLYQGANDSVGFASSAITVTAGGQSAANATGKPEAWFDPAKPVAVRFALLGGETSEATGLLPLHHSVVRGDTEYRFSMVAAEQRGFLSVTGERCRFP